MLAKGDPETHPRPVRTLNRLRVIAAGSPPNAATIRGPCQAQVQPEVGLPLGIIEKASSEANVLAVFPDTETAKRVDAHAVDTRDAKVEPQAPRDERLSVGVPPSFAELLELFQDPVRLYQTINWSGRELLWGVLVLAWMASPGTGLGLGSSTAVLRPVFPEDMGLVAHNEYIRRGTDTGFLGIALFFVAMMAWLRVAVAAGRHAESRVQEVALPALAILIAWGVISLTDNAFDYYGPLTQFAGFFVGASLISGSGARSSETA